MKKTLLIVTVAMTSIAGMAQNKTVELTTAGQLSAQISSSEKYAIAELTVKGPLNGKDIAFIRDMAGKDEEGEITEGQLQVLDLSGASIVAGGVYYTNIQSAVDYEAEANVVGDNMFRELTLTDVKLPAGVTTIGKQAFYKCSSLATVSGVENVANLGESAFESCEKLDGVVLNASLTELPKGLFRRCYSLNITLPDGITRLDEESLYGCKLEGFTLPEGLVTIGKGALQSTGLTTLTLPASVRELESEALYSCSDLAELILNEGLEIIGEDALAYNKAAKKYVIPSTVTTIGKSAMANCKALEEVVLPEGITAIPDYCFDRSQKLASLNIPSTVTSIGECAFQMCYALETIELPDGLESIGDNAFASCEALTGINFPATLTYIGNGSFDSAGLTEVVIPEGITRLGSEFVSFWEPSGSVFSWCTNLKKVTLPSTIESLGMQTFNACPLEELIIYAVTPPDPDFSGFTSPFGFDESIFETCTVHVPVGALDNYKNDSGWGQFINIKEDVTTAIDHVVRPSQNAQNYFDLQGRRSENPTKGLYIIDGHKVIVK